MDMSFISAVLAFPFSGIARTLALITGPSGVSSKSNTASLSAFGIKRIEIVIPDAFVIGTYSDLWNVWIYIYLEISDCHQYKQC